MSDIAGQEFTSESTEGAEPAVETETQDHSTGADQEANPFWGEVEKITGPNVYRLIQPHLAKADTAARQRVEQLNQKLAPWAEFESQGIQPAHVQQALAVVQQLNTNPEQVFSSLQEFLTREGRMPTQTELKQEVKEDLEDPEGQPDPRDQELAALRQQIEQLGGFVTNQYQSQQAAAAAQEADTWLEGEIAQLKDPKNGYDDADIKEIVRIAAFASQQTGQDPDLNAAAQQFNAMRDRIRTAPRPGSSAPRLPMGPGGGTPQAQLDTSSLTKEQRRELAVQILQRGK